MGSSSKVAVAIVLIWSLGGCARDASVAGEICGSLNFSDCDAISLCAWTGTPEAGTCAAPVEAGAGGRMCEFDRGRLLRLCFL